MREGSRNPGRLSTLAGRQHGYVTRRQLLALGLSSSAIGRRSDLIPDHLGVYAVGHVDRTPIARAHAAVLACGVNAALSHDSAAALWGLRRWPAKPEVSAPGEKRRPAIRTYRRPALDQRDVTVNYGMRVTTVVRTIIDIAPRLTDRQAVRLVNDARVRNILGPSAFNQLLARCSRLARLIVAARIPPGRALRTTSSDGLGDTDCRSRRSTGASAAPRPMPSLNAIA